MAGVSEDRRRTWPDYGRGRRPVAVVGMLFVAVLAAIVVILILARRPAHRPPAAAVSPAAPAIAPPAAVEPAPPAAEVRPAAPSAPQRPLTEAGQAQIARVVRDGRPALTACYQRALVRDATLVHARLNVRLSIAASGRVESVRINGPAAFRPLEPCLETAIESWTFPSAPAPYKTEFPLVLQGTE